ncbi:MAG: hypothetical protein HYW89_01060 [Candidatus Sungiibacteriota bacterium]|uniref:Uncharacterized protein n=1 Tax=Candidatus Sungiibacteriota bacterium TaxID=2750080 RepID=A0A7T5RK05_9BACT|nr:MAG: hypothetical protein HYW89_01060 [Candidatus Sungbacteria bacterium]
MAWWAHLLFLEDTTDSNELPQKREPLLATLYRVTKDYVRENIIGILSSLLTLVTYLYLGTTAAVFFLEKNVPDVLPHIIEALSEPYLGILGIYIVVKEIERRRGNTAPKRWRDAFAFLWLILLVVTTVFTIAEHQFTPLYKTVVTNALAALIIRIGTMLR